ncbi:MAG: UDP-N-acetylmuramoyl-L-alanine--D-glutamate ligase [Candidatus Methylomirabilales bacterium]
MERILDVKGKRVTVVGLARSGAAACRFLVSQGARVTGSDHRPAQKMETDLDALRRRGVILEFGGHRTETFLQADLIILSPGVDTNLPLLQEARLKGVRVWSEVELAFRACQAPFVAITGTNGKSTTTALLALMLKHTGRKAMVAGNIGTALCDVVPGLSKEYWVVAEISSFQLETIETFHPRVALLLNVTPDHLDRHTDMAGYIEAKARIFLNQMPEDAAVLNADDPVTLEAAATGKARQIFFSQRQPVTEGAFIKDEAFWLRLGRKEETICHRADLRIQGAHNTENALAAVAAAGLLEIPPESMREVLKQFPGLEHRLEPVAEIAGVRYLNDSKGTNVGATVKSLESFPMGRVILIAGGLDKGADFRPLIPVVKERVKATILIGEAREKMQATLKEACPIHTAANLDEAVEDAHSLAVPGDVVLLSPSCASFDMFRDFEERGAVFKAVVRRLRDRSKDARGIR